MMILTADAGGPIEGLSNLRIDIDQLIAFLGSFEVSGIHLALHPIFEILADDRGQDVDEPLLWQSGSLFVDIWEVSLQLDALVNVGVDGLQSKALILWDVDLASILLLDV